MAEQQRQKKGFSIWWVVLTILVFLLLYSLVQSGTKSEKSISVDQFQNDIGMTGYKSDTGEVKFESDKNKILAIYQEGNTYYLLYNNTVATADEIASFPDNPTKYCTHTVYDSGNIVYNLIREYNWQNPNKRIDFESAPLPSSFMDTLLPWVYIIGFVILMVFMWRSFAGRGGLANMGRNRATVVFNGPIRFTDVAGIEEEKEQVAEIVDFLRHPKKYVDMGARIPKGVLLVGQPGTGKTLLAKAIAGEASVPFFSISGSDFSEMLVGVGPSRMRDLFENAKANAPAIIFLDEIDSIARMRGVGASGVAEENEQTLNQLLVQMDGFSKSEGVIILAATNRPDVLDPALLRPGRFDRQIIVQMPDVKGREQILKVHAKNKPLAEDVDLNRIAKITSGFSGADIENLLNESAIISAKDSRTKITMGDLMEGINKVLMGPQKRSRIITEKDKKITAYHEAGHAIVSRILSPEQTVQEVSIIPRGFAAGYTLTNDQDNEHNHESLSMLKNRLAMLLGGRTAESLFIGDICTGASNDIKVATEIAENMVTKWGMSEKLGPLYYGKDSEVALRFYNDKHTSESVQSVIDSEIKLLISNAQSECKKILSANGSKLKVMANVLLSQETIYAEDITLIMDGKNEKEVITQIEKREKEKANGENKDKVDSMLATLEPLLTRSLETASAFREANLISEEKMEKLKGNCDLAKKYVATQFKLPPVPTLDNIDKYPSLLELKTDEPKTDNGADKTVTKKATKATKANKANPKKSTEQKNSPDKTGDATNNDQNDTNKDKPNADK
ncbi:MAG: ATP-dependent zinc metalloprotease FtsH [Christensenellaceae bacterium]|jgi:cell division protease FtsH|nr:ATP-dependent zinc metalloprotease FtsH [Christensenellaceae bacterium]